MFLERTINSTIIISRVHYSLDSATKTSFSTIFDVSESLIHRLSCAVPFMSIIVAVAEKSGGKVHPQPAPSPSLSQIKIQMLGKILQLQILTYKFVYKKACLSGFHTHQSACELLLGLSHCSSNLNLNVDFRVSPSRRKISLRLRP